MNIITLLNQIRSGEIVLPAIQRDFVWDEDRIIALLDSIMRGYPVGITLLWETYTEIQYRKFVKDYRYDDKQVFENNTQGKRLKVVLDGQQRLQSLYVALYGSYNDKTTYFEVLSGRLGDDLSQQRFLFWLANQKEADEWNNNMIKTPTNLEAGEFQEQYISVKDLFELDGTSRQKLRKHLVKKLGLNEEDESRLETNLNRFNDVLTKGENILKASIIDENLPPASPDRKSEADVLEIFVRINRQGTPLSRSDLIFSILKLRWKESAQALPDLVREINKGNSFDLDTDFIIRCLFAVSNLGTRFDLELLSNQKNIFLMRENFQKCCDAIKSTLDFVMRDCWCQNSTIIGGPATLVPFVYYLFHQKKFQVPNNQIERLRKAFYLVGFANPFSRYADSRLGAFLKKELKPLMEKGQTIFPLEALISWIKYWERIPGYGEELLRNNPTLALHVIQKHTGAKVLYKNNAPEIDHIFPKSVLYKKEMDPALIQHFANLWILAKGKNLNKGAIHPAEYFKDLPDKELERSLIKRDLLDYRRYKHFLRTRSETILDVISKETGLTAEDFRKNPEKS